MPSNEVLLIAGETSGDAHAAKLVTQLKSANPTLRFTGMGQEQMRAAGVNILVDSKDMAVVGFIEIINSFNKIRKSFKVIKEHIEQHKPALVILIDYPGFNLRIAKVAKKVGAKVLYYISPQLWAWHKSRVNIIRRYVDRMAVILPFEVDFYHQHQINANYVGNPLLTDLPSIPDQASARNKLGIKPQQKVIALCPGSRKSELKYLGATLQNLVKEFPECTFVVPAAPNLNINWPGVIVVNNDFYTAIAASDLAVVASGTATLQIALTQTPMIIIYKSHWLSYLMAKYLVDVPMIGLCNIVAGKKIVP
jgi:lipid-A-disaccharide synthase